MANTTLGFPYPAATDPPAGHTQIQALAAAVDLQPGVGSFTQAQITAFTAGEKRAGRIVWNSTTGTLQRCDGSAFVDVVLLSGAQTLANKTLTTPTIASMVNANHDHSAGAGGGLIPESSVTNLVSDLAAKLAGVKSDSAPSTPATNDVWLDTSGTSGVWKIWNGSAWVSFSGGSPAVVSSTTGSPTITSDANYTYYKFTANGSLVIGTAGLVDFLIVGGGTGGNAGTFTGGGGSWMHGSTLLAAGTVNVVVGASTAGGQNTEVAPGSVSSLGALATQRGTISSQMPTLVSSISGASVTYCRPGQASPAANSGDGGEAPTNRAGAAGVVIVRVAK